MRDRIISFLKKNPVILRFCWSFARYFLQFVGLFIRKHPKQMLFASFGGRSFNDSPKAIYDEICKRSEFEDWEIIWAFVNPDAIVVPRGKKIKIDSPSFFKALLQSRVWISNSGMDRNISLNIRNIIKVETWHGTPLKKIGGEEEQNSLGGKNIIKGPVDNATIRCAQSQYDLKIFQRIFHASEESFLLCDLPRNDELLMYSSSKVGSIKETLNIPKNKKIILYVPTYREYLWDDNGKNLIAPPIHLANWKQKLGQEYILLFRAHYTIGTALNIQTDEFLIDVSKYPNLNDLYAIADMMISDYSSCFFDYSILDRPMFCFAYDLDEYKEKRGLYVDLTKELPCRVNETEDELLDDILRLNYFDSSEKTKLFHKKYAPNAGNASCVVVNKILERLNK